MLIAAFAILGAALLLGSVLAVLHLREPGAARPPRRFGALHGLLGIAGFLALLLALRGPARGLETGTASFGLIAAALVGLALLAGGGILATRLLRRRLPGALLGIHATLAVGGVVILAAYVLVG
jgi:hypothetical protein